MGSFKLAGTACLVLVALGPVRAFSADFVAPAFQGVITPIDVPFRIDVKPGWRAHCVSQIGSTTFTIEKSTIDDNGTVLNAHVKGSPRGASAVAVYGVQLYFNGEGAAADVQIEEMAGYPIDDVTYRDLRAGATSVVPEAEFAGRMSDEINAESVAPFSAQRGVDIAINLAVEGTTSSGGEDYVFIRRSGLMSGSLEGQHVAIRFEGYTRVHRASGLIAEQVLNTELRADSASPRREDSRLSCEIARVG
jgi:hypothetical protein